MTGLRQEAVTVVTLDTSSVPAAAARVERSLGGIQQSAAVSARQTANAMRQLPAQLTDIATQLAGGQNPLLILLQQGGQIRDSFGSIGASLRGLASAINPLGLVAGAVAGVGAVALAGANEAAKLRDQLILSGNAAGQTSDQLRSLTERISASSGQTQGQVRELLGSLVESGRTAGAVFDSTATAIARIAELSGKSAVQIASQFSGQLANPSRVASQLNDQYNFLDLAQARRIRRLEDEGRKVEAANLTNSLLIRSLQEQGRELQALEGWWDAAGRALSSYWERFKQIGAPATTGQLIDAARQRVQDLENQLAQNRRLPAAFQGALSVVSPESRNLEARLDAARLDLANLAERMRQERAAADAAAARALGRGEVNGVLNPTKGPRAEDRLGDFIARELQDQVERDRLREERLLAQQQSLDVLIGEQLRAQEERDAQRLTQQAEFLQQYVDQNARAQIELMTDERARGEALIELDREIALRRLAERTDLLPSVRDQAALEINRGASLELQKLEVDLAATSAREMRGDVVNALQAAFQDSQNPARAFAVALGNAIFTRVSSRLADALATAVVGQTGTGGLLGGLLGGLFGIGGVDGSTGGAWLGEGVPSGVPGWDAAVPPPGLATGTNFVPRDMLAVLHKGEAVVPKAYNPAAGGGGVQVNVYGAPAGVERQSVRRGADGTQIVDVVLAAVAGDVQRGGRVRRSITGTFGAGALAPRRG